MKNYAYTIMAILACACFVQVQAGILDGVFSGGDNDQQETETKDEGEKGHYQGGLGKQVIHTVVDGGVDRLVDMGEQQFDNPLIDAAIIGVGHKIKNKLHDRINDFGEDETSESVDETGEALQRSKRGIDFKGAVKVGAKVAAAELAKRQLKSTFGFDSKERRKRSADSVSVGKEDLDGFEARRKRADTGSVQRVGLLTKLKERAKKLLHRRSSMKAPNVHRKKRAAGSDLAQKADKLMSGISKSIKHMRGHDRKKRDLKGMKLRFKDKMKDVFQTSLQVKKAVEPTQPKARSKRAIDVAAPASGLLSVLGGHTKKLVGKAASKIAEAGKATATQLAQQGAAKLVTTLSQPAEPTKEPEKAAEQPEKAAAKPEPKKPVEKPEPKKPVEKPEPKKPVEKPEPKKAAAKPEPKQEKAAKKSKPAPEAVAKAKPSNDKDKEEDGETLKKKNGAKSGQNERHHKNEQEVDDGDEADEVDDADESEEDVEKSQKDDDREDDEDDGRKNKKKKRKTLKRKKNQDEDEDDDENEIEEGKSKKDDADNDERTDDNDDDESDENDENDDGEDKEDDDTKKAHKRNKREVDPKTLGPFDRIGYAIVKKLFSKVNKTNKQPATEST